MPRFSSITGLARPAWEPCPSCGPGEYWCNIHGRHASVCACPPVEEWPEPGPYRFLVVPLIMVPPSGARLHLVPHA